MATKNDVTGDSIQTKLNGDQSAYADGWERIFGKKEKSSSEDTQKPSEEKQDANV